MIAISRLDAQVKRCQVWHMKFLSCLMLSALLLVSGCGTTASTTEYKTISAAETAVNSSYSAYLDLVALGKVSTNAVPQVSKAYNLFQQAASLAIATHNLNPASPVPPELASQVASTLSVILTAEGK